ncbi:HAD-IIB family hydrolase [Orrella daihaiensis]|uniref:HAD-IIB family hydrolase n=1 Tax=Orrella daihaiensis TaxID=2782176 RepID=A0ABY4AI02_9BURK|nr:HAD-IIB family hydrolase [Orrella daihaiensis]UOD49911.1 HAD-IIB family hydrolase [Orrella daihaiensis]
MKPLIKLPTAIAANIEYVLCDIDDTVTTEGHLTAQAYSAMQSLHDAGIHVIPITGRPAGWCDHIARMWPVSAVVGENGAFFMRYDHSARKMEQQFWTDAGTRESNRQKLDLLAKTILAKVPGCALASDQPYRIADLAIDFCEDVEPLPESAIEEIVSFFKAAGATAKVSSIHVNGWFGQYDKLTMTKQLFVDVFGQVITDLQEKILFIGDSPNDAPMFGFFDNSVGVANVRDQIHRLQHLPKFVCQNRGGAGFAEMATYLLTTRK